MKKALCLIIATVLALALYGCRVMGTERVRVPNVPYTTTRTVPRTDTRRNITANTPRTRRVNPYKAPLNTARVRKTLPNANDVRVNPAVPDTVVRTPVNTVA